MFSTKGRGLQVTGRIAEADHTGTGERLSGVRLHLGCGTTVARGWINMDKSPSVWLSRAPRFRKLLGAMRILTEAQVAGMPPGVVSADVSRHIPVADAVASAIYSAHMIEHLAHWRARRFLEECHRVLCTDGVLRLATPDLGLLISDYLGGSSPFQIGRMTRGEAFCEEFRPYQDLQTNFLRYWSHRMFAGDTHQWLYDFDSLQSLLLDTGFSKVTRCSYRAGELPDLENVEHRERGLFVEARA